MRYLSGRALLFDMDGTLIDSNEASEAIWQRWAMAHQVPIERIRAVHHGRRPEETITIVAPHLDAIAEAGALYREQEDFTRGIYPIMGARDFYDSVPRRQRAIVTAATRRILELRLGLVGLQPPEVCVTAEMLKAGKPDPEGYLQAARQLGYEPRDCIVFEDAPAGLIAAHRAGMQSVAVLTNYTEAALRHELDAEALPAAFRANLVGLSFQDGMLMLP